MIGFTAPLWRWQGGNWHFITLPDEAADEIRFEAAGLRGGFGSIRVEVIVGDSRWRTSLFPDKKSESFLLPVKKVIRVAEDLEVGQSVAVSLEPLG